MKALLAVLAIAGVSLMATAKPATASPECNCLAAAAGVHSLWIEFGYSFETAYYYSNAYYDDCLRSHY